MSGQGALAEKDVRKSLREIWFFPALAFAISWGVGAAYILFPGTAAWLGPMSTPSAGFYIIGCAPSVSALILSLAFGGFAGVKALLARLVRPFNAVWLLVAVLTFPLLAMLIEAVKIFGHSHWHVQPSKILITLPLVLFTTGQIVTNTGPLGEEFGWRGYLLPRLLERWNAVTCGLIIGFFWTIWHVPAFLVRSITETSLASYGWWALNIFALSLFMTWLFVRANGNIAVAGVIPHFVINGMGRIGAWEARRVEAICLTLLMVIVIAVSGMDFGKAGKREV